MVQITIKIPVTQEKKVLNAICKMTGYSPKINNGFDKEGNEILINNPITKKQHVKKQIIHYLKNLVVQHEINVSRNLAVNTKRQELEQIKLVE